MRFLLALFLIAHGLVHLPVWVIPKQAKDDAPAPFDPSHSWLIADGRRAAVTLAIAATVVLSLSGVLLLLGASIWAPVAVVGAAISLSLIFVTFNPWLIVGVVINVGIILDVLVWHVPATAFP